MYVIIKYTQSFLISCMIFIIITFGDNVAQRLPIDFQNFIILCCVLRSKIGDKLNCH